MLFEPTLERAKKYWAGYCWSRSGTGSQERLIWPSRNKATEPLHGTKRSSLFSLRSGGDCSQNVSRPECCRRLAAMPLIEHCPDLTVLMGRMHSDLQVYCEAVEQLSHRDGVMTLDVVYERSERARLAFELARDRLKTHLAEHGCMR